MKIEELEPVIRTNLADLLIEQIITLIKEKKLKVNESFFSERQLAAQFGVSRVTVRETTKRLGQMGFLTSKPGNGYIISKPTPEFLLEPLIDAIILTEEDNKNIIEVRRILETHSAVMATSRASETDIKELLEIIKYMERNINNYDIFSDYDYFLHIRIAQATYNPFLYKLISSIRKILKKEIKELAKVEVNRKNVFKIHKEIVEGIKKRDPELVINSFNLHFDNVEKCYRKIALQNNIEIPNGKEVHREFNKYKKEGRAFNI